MDKDNGFNDERELSDEELAGITGGLSVTDLLNVGDVTLDALNRVAVGNVTSPVTAPVSITGNDLSL